MPYTGQPADRFIPAAAEIPPQSANNTTKDTGWVDMRKFQEAQFIALVGAIDSTIDVKLQEAQDSGGTGAQDLSGKSATQLAATDDNKVVVLNLKAEELTKTGYTHARMRLTLGNGSAQLVAGLSGLRKNELRQLEKRDLTPTGDHPTWHLRPEIVKGRRLDRIPILKELLPVLLPLWQALPEPTSRLFASVPGPRTLRTDQRKAKVAHTNSEGKTADFHSFRYFFCVQMSKTLSIQKVKVLMRHKTIKLTADLYGELGLADVGEEVWELPPILSAATGAAKAKRTHGG